MRTVASPSKLHVALKHSWPDVTFITAANKKMGAVQMGREGEEESKKEQNKKREMKRGEGGIKRKERISK